MRGSDRLCAIRLSVAGPATRAADVVAELWSIGEIAHVMANVTTLIGQEDNIGGKLLLRIPLILEVQSSLLFLAVSASLRGNF